MNSDELVCEELVELVTEYLEGGLSEPERTRFEHHLTTCRGCENYLEQMRQTVAAVGALSVETIDPGSLDTLLGAFRDWKRT